MKQRGRRVPPASPAPDPPYVPHPDESVERSLASPMTSHASDQAIDLSVQRECLYRDFGHDPGPCPRCGGELVQQYASYLIATRNQSKQADSFMIGSDAGWFCRTCPTIVINRQQIGQTLSYGGGRWNVGREFTILGLVNLDAVPPEKRHLPLGEADNPIPLVEFRAAAQERDNERGPRKQRRR
jgi:hypothetical protein